MNKNTENNGVESPSLPNSRQRAAQAWCYLHNANKVMDTELAESFARIHNEDVEKMTRAAEMLWVVLANVSGGNWGEQTAEWQEAAARWRDNYHKTCSELQVKTA